VSKKLQLKSTSVLQERQPDMTHIRTFRDLDAWRVGMDTALATYRLTLRLPDTERYGLISQMRRAATSVPSNVAEGQARNSPKAFLHFLAIALGSTAELDTQLELCVRLKYLVPEATADLRESLERLRQLLYGLRRAKRRELAASLGRATGVVLLAFALCTYVAHFWG
jgi:four helix bundle protein